MRVYLYNLHLNTIRQNGFSGRSYSDVTSGSSNVNSALDMWRLALRRFNWTYFFSFFLFYTEPWEMEYGVI